jgi:hypothetical protein
MSSVRELESGALVLRQSRPGFANEPRGYARTRKHAERENCHGRNNPSDLASRQQPLRRR